MFSNIEFGLIDLLNEINEFVLKWIKWFIELNKWNCFETNNMILPNQINEFVEMYKMDFVELNELDCLD